MTIGAPEVCKNRNLARAGKDGDKTRGIPVVTYHGIGPDRPGRESNHLLTPLELFEGQMKALRDNGWTTISLTHLCGHMFSGEPVPEKPVVLTFDGGYLDNYVLAWPILQKYGHRAAVWVTTDFIDPATDPGPTLESGYSGGAWRSGMPVSGFLSMAEMRLMEASGHIEIQSRAKTGTCYPTGPKIIDFHRPVGVDGYMPPPWLAWNAFPESKHEYMSRSREDEISYGTPVYFNSRSLDAPRYYPDPALSERLVLHVIRNGGDNFFAREGWRGELESIAAQNPPSADSVETQAEYLERALFELTESRRILSDGLGHRVDFLCWPGDSGDPGHLELAKEAGYFALAAHFDKDGRRNVPGQDPSRIAMIESGSPWAWKGRLIRGTDPGFFISILENFAGGQNTVWTMRSYKLKYLLRHYLTGTI
jgi:hypothetical protein